MKLSSRFPVAAVVLAGCFTASSVFGQNTGKDRMIEFKDIKIAVQKTPDFTLKGGTTDKRFRAKDWIEIEPEFRAIAPKNADKNLKVISDVVFKYYVFLSGPGSADRKILTGEVTHTNISFGEVSHSVVYVTPSTILRVAGKPEGSPQLVTGCAVEATVNGEIVGFYSKLGGAATDKVSPESKWWEKGTAPKQEADLLNKAQSPFAPLWADYYADIKATK
ncbi:MAG: hypothetical protein JWM59_2716 [Verrucomicrobiales bacterium]|nr:hypothetical protein [Verrucomicrobiales bacterium]